MQRKDSSTRLSNETKGKSPTSPSQELTLNERNAKLRFQQDHPSPNKMTDPRWTWVDPWRVHAGSRQSQLLSSSKKPTREPRKQSRTSSCLVAASPPFRQAQYHWSHRRRRKNISQIRPPRQIPWNKAKLRNWAREREGESGQQSQLVINPASRASQESDGRNRMQKVHPFPAYKEQTRREKETEMAMGSHMGSNSKRGKKGGCEWHQQERTLSPCINEAAEKSSVGFFFFPSSNSAVACPHLISCPLLLFWLTFFLPLSVGLNLIW